MPDATTPFARTFEKTILIPAPLEEVFEFFSQAENLQEVTPSWLHFRFLTPLPIQMQLGTEIEYQLRLYGIPVRWKTRITGWRRPTFFEDTQLRGPYRLWIHQHIFQAVEDETRMTDRVRFLSPGWYLEPVVNALFVSRRISEIFDFREQELRKVFG